MSRSAITVWLLGATQIIGYGSLYYSFSVLAPGMGADLGLPLEWVYGAFSVALLFGGLASPRIGRAFDRYGAGKVMAVGSILAPIALCLCALAPQRMAFAAGMIAIEIAAIFVLYEAAFAALVQTTGKDAARRITHLTLIAGFASTIFWPLTSFLHAHMSWREVFFVFAAMHVVICFPVHLWLSQHKPMAAAMSDKEQADAPGFESLEPSQQRRAFALLLCGFAIVGFVMSALLVHMIPVLTGLGLGAMSALVGAVFGPAQVMSRIVNMCFGRELHPLRLSIISALLLPVSICLLALAAPWLAAALMFSALFGLGSGLTSIVKGTVPLALFGPDGYGDRIGKITSARLILSSLAPFAFSLAIERIGTVPALYVLALLGFIGAGALLLIDRMRFRAESGPTEQSFVG